MTGEFFSEFGRFVRANRPLVAATFLAAILSYGFGIANVSLSIDEEFHLISDQTSAWAEQGRFGIALLKRLLNFTAPIPFFQPALAVALLCLAVLAWSFLLSTAARGRLSASPWLLLFAVLCVSFPTNSYYLSFNTYNVEVSAGFLFTALCVHFSWAWVRRAGGAASLGWAVAFCLAAISIYQVFLLVCATGLVIVYLIDLETQPPQERHGAVEIIRVSIRLAVPLAGAYVLYRAINALSRALDTSPTSSSTYIDDFLLWGKFGLGFVLHRLLSGVVEFLAGVYFAGGWIVPILVVVGVVAFFRLTWGVRQASGFLAPAMVAIVLASPLILSLALGNPMPNRTQLVAPLAYSALVPIAMLAFGVERKARVIALITAALMVVLDGRTNTALSYSEYLVFERDSAMAEHIVGLLQQDGWTGEPIPMVTIGKFSYPPVRYIIKTETIGASFFEWDNGGRALTFLSALGHNFLGPTPEQRDQGLAEGKAMPVWPAAGSVKISNGVAIVKLGPE